jgi:ubiquinone/menaquinone biosynthesis C-methylase UbiE
MPGEQAVRQSYDAVAADYAELLSNELAAKPMDRAILAAFAEYVTEDGGGPVLDVGCGPGRIADHLTERGLSVRGVDLSQRMVDEARLRYPKIRFDQGCMTALDVAEAELAAVVAWYSVIHTPTDELPAAFAEFARVLRPGGRLLLAFQVGDTSVELERAYGHAVSLVVHRRSVERVATLLADAGLPVDARTVRGPERWESSPQAFVLAHRPSS